MQRRRDLREAIERITEMEAIFDRLLEIHEKDSAALRADAAEMLEQLIRYYESPLWRADFELDEQGLLPGGLKRGILSEDGIYNFLSEIR